MGNKLIAQRSGAFGSFLLSITCLAGITVFSLLAPKAAQADCSPAPVANGATVPCTVTDTDGFTTTFDQITVTVLDGASVSNAGAASLPLIL